MANTNTYINKIVVPNGSDTITANLVDTVSGYTKNTGTVTSVQVQGTSPIVSSQSTAQTGTLSTTISHADSGVTAGTYGSSSLIPVITVDSKGHLTSVTTSSASGGVNDVQVNGTSVVSSGTANIVTNTAYNASTNKIATMADVDVVTITYTVISGTDYEMNISTVAAPNYAQTILGEAY